MVCIAQSLAPKGLKAAIAGGTNSVTFFLYVKQIHLISHTLGVTAVHRQRAYFAYRAQESHRAKIVSQ